MHFFTFARVTSVRKVQVFPPHLIVAYRSGDRQLEVNIFCVQATLTHKHMYTPLCKGEALTTSPTDCSTMVLLTDGPDGGQIS